MRRHRSEIAVRGPRRVTRRAAGPAYPAGPPVSTLSGLNKWVGSRLRGRADGDPARMGTGSTRRASTSGGASRGSCTTGWARC